MSLGLIPPASGTLRVFGLDPGDDNELIGYVPQHYAATVGEAVRGIDAVLLGQAKGINVRGINLAFMLLLGLAVTMAIQAVGSLLLFALLITPAATAIALTPRPALAMTVSAGLAVGCVWLGLVASAMFNAPLSFLIVTIVTSIWLAVWWRTRRRRSRRINTRYQLVGAA